MSKTPEITPSEAYEYLNEHGGILKQVFSEKLNAYIVALYDLSKTQLGVFATTDPVLEGEDTKNRDELSFLIPHPDFRPQGEC